MRAPSRFILLGGLLLSLHPAAARAGDFIDSRISFTLGDDNFLQRAGKQLPDSPLIGMGDREGYELPFDNLDLATTGRENELHLAVYKKVAGLLPGLTTEVAAAMQIDLAQLEGETSELGRTFSDDSSYIRLAYAVDPGKRGERYLDLVLFPLSGDRFRVGYLYDLTWGGNNMFPRKKGASPAFKLGGNHGFLYWWAGMKMVLAMTGPEKSAEEQGQPLETAEAETLYSALVGVGSEPVEGLSLDLSGGYIQMARSPIQDVLNEVVTATGFSARVAYGRGLKVGLSSDLRLIRNDPEYLESLSRKPTYAADGKVNWRVGLEGATVAQVLADPELYGGTTRQWAMAAALDARLQYNYLRVNITGVYRGLEFALLDTPSFTPFIAMPQDAIIQPQIFAAVSADYHFPTPALTPGIQAGVELPAAVKTELYAVDVGSNASPTLVGTHTMLVRTSGERVILPEDKGRMPVFSVRLNTRWYASDILTLLAFVMLAYDQNSTIMHIDADLTKVRVFQEPLRFGAGFTAQARF